ncbi:MAG: hypothetical protein EBR58_07195, partial [Betaproteobacteria bacterium]|nr:hypothetical protein [Betaproteobacteria bacterium]
MAVLVVVAGMLLVGWRTLQADNSKGASIASAAVPAKSASSVVAPTSPATPAAVLALGQTAVNASNCMRCHGVDRRYVGPAFNQVSARYQGRA